MMYFLSNQQQSIINVENYFVGSSINTVGGVADFNRHYDYNILNYACNRVLAENDAFQIRYDYIDGRVVQNFVEYQHSDLQLYNFLSDKDGYDKFIEKMMNKCLFSYGEKLYEIFLLVMPNGNTGIAVFMHHSITDAWSMAEVYFNSLCRYAADAELNNNQSNYSLTPAPSFKEVLEKNSVYNENSKTFQSDKAYWESKINEYEGIQSFGNISPKDDLTGKRYSYEMSVDDNNSLRELSEAAGISVPNILIAALSIIKSYQSFTKDISLGMAVLGRNGAREKATMGAFAKVVPLILSVDSDLGMLEFFKCIKKGTFELFRHQQYPYEKILEYMSSEHGESQNLIEMCFSYQNVKYDKETNGYSIEWKNSTNLNIPLTVHVSDRENDGRLYFDFDYISCLFSEKDIVLLNRRIQFILKQFINNIHNLDIKISNISVIDDEEKRLIIEDFNNTFTTYPGDKTVVELFEEQVEKTPDNIAVIFEDEKITYAELNSKANQLAKRLRVLGVKQDDFVVIMSERSIDMIIGILGIIKAGGAYVPIEPSYPKERIRYILNDCNPKVIVHLNLEEVLDTDIETINLSDKEIYTGDFSNPSKLNTPNDLIYAIYTSGTSGKPKGVMIEHKSVIRLVRNTNYVELNSSSVILQTGAMSFDASTFELWGAILNGGQLCLVDNSILLNGILLKEAIVKYKINIMFITTALFNQMINFDKDIFNDLTYLMFGGEKTSENHVRMMIENNKSRINLANVYGPTENTTFTTYYHIDRNNLANKTPIGKPISNTQVYILNGRNLCGIGMPGELCIGGAGLARGYLNQPELTIKQFIDNPFGEGKLYRTGDLVRWLPDGNIEYLERMDEQIKIRGFRIELGEIENVIRQIKNIIDVVVVVNDNGNSEKNICAYVISDQEVNISELKNEIRKELPEFMVPAFLMQLESIPVTSNGKVDKKRLPRIEMKSTAEYVKPQNEMQEKLVKVYEEVLGVSNIGIKDNFFENGGDSIKAIRVVSKMRELGYELNIKDIMKLQSVEAICGQIGVLKEIRNYEQGEVTGTVPLTPIQEAFFEWGLEVPQHFNQSIMLKSHVKINEEALSRTLKEIVKHHDILRAVYNGKQQIKSIKDYGKLYDLQVFDVNNEDILKVCASIEEKCTSLQESIDLVNGPLMKVGLFKTPVLDYIMISLHHLVVDGVSWRIILSDLIEGYQQYIQTNKIQLPLKTASFKEWAEALHEYSEDKKVLGELGYWTNICKKAEECKIPGDIFYDRKHNFAVTSIEFTGDKFEKLVHKSNKVYGAEINDVLITALGMTIRKWKNQETFAVELEGHGRQEIQKDIAIDRTVGWFTCKYPIIISAAQTIEDNIINTKEMLREVPNHGMAYGVLRYINKYEALKTNIDISFNYLGNIDNDLKNNAGIEYTNISSGLNISPKNILPNSISFDGIVSDGRLIFNITYDEAKYSSNSVKELGKMYIESLDELLEHCMSIQENVKTASDVGANSLSNIEIDALNNLLENLSI